tara:strand:- start:397 stop:585 length:189 start_codon:yes stop_codon:yes gene_type:complete
MASTYQSIINCTSGTYTLEFEDASYKAETENESVEAVLAAYTVDGHNAEDILSIETRAYESA